ncbi:MAG: HPr(Ser) kinase/phosphatase [Lentisphaerae bacterium]|nr:HPr(Ser) kinase/phosphatase [Lentisphaerota bacterium]
MKDSNVSHKRIVTVGRFVQAAHDLLKIETIAGESGMERHIAEATINRPGLALSGFFEHFANRRIQVLGLAEIAYLAALSNEMRGKALRRFFDAKIPCVVVARNKGVCREIRELAEEFAVPALRTKLVTKHFVNGATITMENLMAPAAKMQGTMVEIMGIGVLIDGKPGLGKSETALGLIKRGHALVSDDITNLRVDSSGRLLGSPVSVTRYHMEIRGLGIIHVPSLFGVSSVIEEKSLDLIVTLTEWRKGQDDDATGDGTRIKEILGVQVPHVIISVAPGRDTVSILETAALDQKLKRLGHDAAKELDDRLITSMMGGRNGSE